MAEATLESIASTLARLEASQGRLEASQGRLEASHERLEASYERLQTAQERLEASHERLEAKFDAATGGGTLTLAFLAKQQELILEEQARFREDLTVLTGICLRLEGANEGLPVEVRGIRARQDRLIRQVERMNERIAALEGADPA